MRFDNSNPLIQIRGEIARAAHFTKEANALRLWIIIREQREKRELPHIINSIQKFTGLSKQSIQSYLKKYDGVWWDIRSGRVWFYGINKIGFEHFELNSLGYTVSIRLQSFKNLTLFKATLYDAWFSQFKNNHKIFYKGKPIDHDGRVTISRTRLREIFRISKHTQIRYEKLTGMNKRFQFVEMDVDEEDEDLLPTKKDAEGKLLPGQSIERMDNGKIHFTRQLPNSYYAKSTVIFGNTVRYRRGDPISNREWEGEKPSSNQSFERRDRIFYSSEDQVDVARNNETIEAVFYKTNKPNSKFATYAYKFA